MIKNRPEVTRKAIERRTSITIFLDALLHPELFRFDVVRERFYSEDELQQHSEITTNDNDINET